jgi:hypothetical protein
MIEKCDTPNVFKDLSHLYCIKGFDKNGVYAYMGIDLRMPENAVLHLEVVRFSHTILKQLVGDWQGIVRILKENNTKTIAVTQSGETKDHEVWLKFIRWFGFCDIVKQITSIQEI